ncbi:MAG: hypothetical protein F4186_00670 [Boseongicola sp. SB0676_bin_33]|uniref:Uncharacterized protein n=1 Tax=Boseongicola sp. SB0664_bin_43 TaxID=2604844 RepID=A0A6B0Y1Z4_9RHOB|nr:hypothetical protein [Boseongicola sp. SB0664_bin_43]MYF88021.1 hypothetical protein [Boseongicola sp. SB0676_bin_33]
MSSILPMLGTKEIKLPGTGTRSRSPWLAPHPVLFLFVATSVGAATDSAVSVSGGSPTHGAAVAAADSASPVADGEHVGGLRHGPWRIAHPDGSVEEGCYIGGLLHGEWVLRDPAGRIIARERWCLGRSAGPGPVDGEDDLCGVLRFDECVRSGP